MFDIDPVFARTLPSPVVPVMRPSIEPSTPATGSAVIQGDVPDASYMRRRTASSSSGAITSRRDNPDPSTSC